MISMKHLEVERLLHDVPAIFPVGWTWARMGASSRRAPFETMIETGVCSNMKQRPFPASYSVLVPRSGHRPSPGQPAGHCPDPVKHVK